MLQVCDTRLEERLAGEGELLAGLQVISNFHFCTVINFCDEDRL